MVLSDEFALRDVEVHVVQRRQMAVADSQMFNPQQYVFCECHGFHLGMQ